MKLALTALMCLSASLARPINAAACSCREATPSRRAVPDDGAAGFPTDGVVRVFVSGFPSAVRDELAREYRLVDARGATVPTRAAWVGTRLDLRPVSPLRPHAPYVIERVFAYDASGALVGDTQRFSSVRDAPSRLRRAWFPEVRFETGDGPASHRAADAFTRVVASGDLRFGGGDCGPGLAIGASFVLPAGVASTDLVRLEVRGQGLAPTVVQTRPAAGADTLSVNDLLCTPDPVTVPYRPPLSVRVSLVDAADTTLSTSEWAAASITPRMPLPQDWETERRTTTTPPEYAEVLRRGWTAPPLVAAVAAPTTGPAACRFGLETVSRREVAPEGGRAAYEDSAALSLDGSAGWLAVADGPQRSDSRLFSVAPDATTRAPGVSLAGAVTSIASLDGGPLVAVTRYDAAGRPSTQLRALAADGALRWSTSIGVGGRQHRLAVGGDTALVVWRSERDPMRPRLGWALFDARRGRPIGPPHDTALDVDVNGAPVAAWAGDRFVIAWPAPRVDTSTRASLRTDAGARASVRVASLPSSHVLGAPRAVSMDSDGPPDLVAVGERLALVAAYEGVVRWALLTRDGAVLRGPVELSEGVGEGGHRKPRVSARDGLFAVTWEAAASDDGWATVVDDTGAFAPAHRLSEGRHASTGLVVGAGARSFVGAYTVDFRRAWLSALRCREAAPGGPPPRIAPAVAR